MLPELRSPHGSLSWHKAKGFIVIRASHKTITGNACRNEKLLVIQQVGSSPTLLKATSCRTHCVSFVCHSVQRLGFQPVCRQRSVQASGAVFHYFRADVSGVQKISHQMPLLCPGASCEKRLDMPQLQEKTGQRPVSVGKMCSLPGNSGNRFL
ncbi:hypothetical protein Dpo_3c02160 [Desulfotignum phosphitoxidans DSM 13687]|uniref:Uncharacterized protein n=1 Tax=Desulfotignum phosphitoxidans DSM 13687 TaxID=1286635 RepID=S0FYB6_9BACT|nr:hypothetical protein Dpo_3c02160 [Desulfotignum phosphitoxidans DSM 13687]